MRTVCGATEVSEEATLATPPRHSRRTPVIQYWITAGPLTDWLLVSGVGKGAVVTSKARGPTNRDASTGPNRGQA